MRFSFFLLPLLALVCTGYATRVQLIYPSALANGMYVCDNLVKIVVNNWTCFESDCGDLFSSNRVLCPTLSVSNYVDVGGRREVTYSDSTCTEAATVIGWRTDSCIEDSITGKGFIYACLNDGTPSYTVKQYASRTCEGVPESEQTRVTTSNCTTFGGSGNFVHRRNFCTEGELTLPAGGGGSGGGGGGAGNASPQISSSSIFCALSLVVFLLLF